MANNEFRIPAIDSLSRDYEAIRDDMIKMIPFFTPEWTDLNPSDFGIVLIELFAAHLDNLHWYLDRRLSEPYPDLMLLRQSAINMFKLIDFRLRAPAASVVTLVFALPSVQGTDFTIPAGTQVQSTGGLIFETDDDLIITAGSLGNEVDLDDNPVFGASASRGETITETVPQIPTSDGSAFQEIVFRFKPVIQDSQQMFWDEGAGAELWPVVETLADSLPTSKEYELIETDTIKFLRFGDNAQGKIPDIGATPTLIYRIGGGAAGNVPAGEISTVLTTLPLSVTVTNPEAAAGGEDAQTLAEARIAGPRSIRALNRAVTSEDYKFFAEQFPGIARIAAISQGTGRLTTIVVLQEGGGEAPQALLDSLVELLDTKRMITDVITARSAKFGAIDIIGTVQVLPTFLNLDVQNRVIIALNNFFDADISLNESSSAIDFGKTITHSDIVRLIDEINGVDYVDLTTLTLQPEVDFVTKTGDYTVSSVAVGATSLRETWTIQFNSATTFTASGTASGVQSNTGVMDSAYISDNNEVSFTVISGSIPPAISDQFRFRTSVKVGNILIDEDQIAVPGITALTFVGGA